MTVLSVVSEYFPLAKSGGLADAAAALCEALAAEGARVLCVLPRYSIVDTAGFQRRPYPLGVPLGHGEEWVGVLHRRRHGVDLFLIDHEALFGSRSLYGPTASRAYSDNLLRFALLSRGALQLALAEGEEPQIVHAHDWTSALTPVYLDLRYRELLPTSRSVFTIHNFGYQGIFGAHEAGVLGLTDDEVESSGLASGDDLNLMRGALLSADAITAVSPQYAREIQQPRHGFGLHREAQERADVLSGIINGIDVETWDPTRDPLLPAHFSASDLSGKAQCKRALQRELGLPDEPDIPLIGLITRLVDQKGIVPLFDPDTGAVGTILEQMETQIVVLGSGEPWCEEEIAHLAAHHPHFVGRIGYDNGLAHRIEAASDFFLMPSVYEPCGLNQMYSMRYGTLPIVTRTGGLADTVDIETGVIIEDGSASAIVTAVERAVELYREEPERLEQMRRAAMARDFSWDRSAREYGALFDRIARPRGAETPTEA